MRLLNDCAGFYPHADLNMAENLIVCLEVAVDSVQRGLVDSLDRGTQANAGRIPPLKSLVRKLQHLLHRWEMLALRAVSCTSVRPIRTLSTLSASNARVGRPAYEISIFKKQSEIYLAPLFGVELDSSRCYYTSLADSDLDELIENKTWVSQFWYQYDVGTFAKHFGPIYVVNVEVVLPAIEEAVFFQHALGYLCPMNQHNIGQSPPQLQGERSSSPPY